MAVSRLLILTSVGLALAGCNQPTPRYAQLQTPPPYRIASDGAVIDNADVVLDAEGYRLDKNGNRIQEVDVPAKTAEYGASNPVAGYYISSIGTTAPGNVMEPSEGAGVGASPGSAGQLPSGQPAPQVPTPLMPTPGETPPPMTPTPR